MRTLELMQGLAQRVAAIGLELVNPEATYGELAWGWGRGQHVLASTWGTQLWSVDDELVAWAWAQQPHQLPRSDGTVKDVTGAHLIYQVHPAHARLVDRVIGYFDEVAAGLERTVVPPAGDRFALERWAAHGYATDPASLGDTGDWTQLNERDLAHLEEPVLPAGFRFRTADDVGPEATVQAHLDAWAPSTYTAEACRGVQETTAYRGDLHFLVEAPDGTMAASTIMWFDEKNRTVEFEPVGTHPAFRRQGLARAMLWYGMEQARAAGATRATVACMGAPGIAAARTLYHRIGFREISRDAPLIKLAG